MRLCSSNLKRKNTKKGVLSFCLRQVPKTALGTDEQLGKQVVMVDATPFHYRGYVARRNKYLNSVNIMGNTRTRVCQDSQMKSQPFEVVGFFVNKSKIGIEKGNKTW